MKDSTRAAVIAVLAILAVSVAAATLDSTVTPERSGPEGPRTGSGEGDGAFFPPPQTGPTPGEVGDNPLLVALLVALTAIVGAAVLVYAFIYWRETLKIALALAAVLGGALVLVRFLPLPAAPPPMLADSANGSLAGGGGGAETTQPSPQSLVFLLVLGLALAGALVALFRRGADGSEDPDDESDASGPGPDAAAVGRAAGRAANRLERESDVDNEVYRAWREMTDLLDVDNPEASTPGEFADAAAEAGLGREDVDELTRLFEDVRYGDARPSEEHERRAVSVFRRIEDRYAGEEP